MVSPVNGSGAYSTAQTFQVQYNSPHANLDFNYGQVQFLGPVLNCTVQWTLSGSLAVLDGQPGCTLNTAGSSVSNNGTNQVTVTLSLTFVSGMLGQSTIEAFGTDSEGLPGPASTISTFNVTGTPVPEMLFPSYPSSYYVVPIGVAANPSMSGVAINGATGPVNVGAVTNSNPQSVTVSSSSLTTQGQASTLALNVTGSQQTAPPASLTYPICAGAALPTCAGGTSASAALSVMVLPSAGSGTISGYFPGINAPAQEILAPGGTVTFPVTFVPNGAITSFSLVFTGQQAGITISASPSTITLDGTDQATAYVTIQISPTLAAGTYALSVYGSGSAIMRNSPTIFTTVTTGAAQDFSLGPVTQESLAAGGSAKFSLEVSPLNGFTGTVALSSTGLQGVATLGFSPASVSLSGGAQTVTGALSVVGNAGNGTYSVPFTGTSGTLSHTGSVGLSVQGGSTGSAPNYSVATSPAPAAVNLGQTLALTVGVTPVAGFTGAVTATVTAVTENGLAANGLTAVFANGLLSQSVTLSGTATQNLTLNVAANLPISIAGCYFCSVSLSLSGGGIQKSLTVPVTVNPPAPISVTLNYTLSGTPQVLSLTPTGVQNALGPVTYYWNTSWGLSGVAAAPPWNFSGLPAGPAWASVTVVDASGRSASSNVVAVMIGSGTTPSYSLDAPTGPNGSFIVAQGSSTNAYIILSSFNGYTGAPALSLGTLPAGINVSFSNGGIETYGVVTATISASASTIVPGGHYTIPIYSTDGTLSYNSLSLPVLVQGAPLSVNSGVAYTNISPVSHTGTFTRLTLVATGGTAPFTYAVSNGMAMTTSAARPQIAVGNMASPAANSSAQLTVTVTDSGSPQQVVTEQITVQAPAALPDQYMQVAMLSRVNALNAFATQLPDQGAAIIAAFETAAGITPAQFGTSAQSETLSGVASQYQSALTSSHVAYNNLRAGYSKSGQSVPASAVQSLVAAQAALPATYLSRVQSALGQTAFDSLDNYGWEYFSSMDYCEGGYDDDGDCGDPGGGNPDAGESWDIFYTHWAGLDLDPNSGQMVGESNVSVWGVVYNGGPYEWTISDPALTMSITGPGVVWPNGGPVTVTNDCGLGCTTATISGAQATTAGIYALQSEATDQPSILGETYGIDDTIVIAALWNNNCVGPQITSISVYANGSQLPQPTNALTVPSSGFMYIQGACLDATTTATVDGNGVTVGVWVVPDSGESTVEVTYNVAANATLGPTNLYLSTDAGITNTTINIVGAGPYISSVTPGVWQSGAQGLPVTINGAGFGMVAGNVQISDPSVTFTPTTWSDGFVIGTVSVNASGPETVTVSVTAGAYGAGFAANPDQGLTAQDNADISTASTPVGTITWTGFNGNPINVTNTVQTVPQTVAVGQQIQLTANLPAGVTAQSHSWAVLQKTTAFQGWTTGGYPCQTNPCPPGLPQSGRLWPTTSALQTLQTVNFYFTVPGNNLQVQDTVTLTSGVVIYLTTNFTALAPQRANVVVGTPTGPNKIPTLGAVNTFNQPTSSNIPSTLTFGCPPNTPNGSGLTTTCPPNTISGIMFNATANNPSNSLPGSIQFVQLLTGGQEIFSLNAGGNPSSCNQRPGLDTAYPYQSPQQPPAQTTDNPGLDLVSSNYLEEVRTFSAAMYVMWVPSAISASLPSIAVPLGYVAWDWAGDSLFNGSSWSLNSNSGYLDSAGKANQGKSYSFTASHYYSSDYPSWGLLSVCQ